MAHFFYLNGALVGEYHGVMSEDDAFMLWFWDHPHFSFVQQCDVVYEWTRVRR